MRIDLRIPPWMSKVRAWPSSFFGCAEHDSGFGFASPAVLRSRLSVASQFPRIDASALEEFGRWVQAGMPVDVTEQRVEPTVLDRRLPWRVDSL